MRHIFTAIIILVLSGGLTKADILSDAWGIATDPFKLGEGSKNALQAVQEARDLIIAIGSLQDEIDRDIDRYLRDVDAKIIKIESLIDQAGGLIDKTANEIRDIERQLVGDFRAILRETECTIIRTTDEVIRQAFSRVPTVLTGDERVIRLPYGTQKTYLLGFIPTGREPKTYAIDISSNPTGWQVFKEIENALLENLKLSSDTDDAVLIYSTWAQLASLAKLTACFHKDEQFEQTLIRKHARYNAMVYPWNYAVRAEE
jgi:ElaB/YqjD/DUF883 family membrane-anchored ribosome-binding protein